MGALKIRVLNIHYQGGSVQIRRITNTKRVILAIVFAYAATAVALALPVTQIIVDGSAGDWDTNIALHSDRARDAENGYLDFTQGYAFVNLDSLYFLVNVTNSAAAVVQFDLFVIVDGRTHLLSWAPGDTQAGHADANCHATSSSSSWGPRHCENWRSRGDDRGLL